MNNYKDYTNIIKYYNIQPNKHNNGISYKILIQIDVLPLMYYHFC